LKSVAEKVPMKWSPLAAGIFVTVTLQVEGEYADE
jgi:hypothetical protein